MARTVRNAKIDTRSARSKQKPRREPYWTVLQPRCALGYRSGANGGTWIARLQETGGRKYYQAIGAADNVMDADGVIALSFAQAQERAREWFKEQGRRVSGLEPEPSGPYTVGDALREYLSWLSESRKSAEDARYRVNALILPALGNIECAILTSNHIRRWLSDLATNPVRLRTRMGEPQKFSQYDPKDPETVRRRRASANRTLTILRAALSRAWREGKIQDDRSWRRIEPFREVDVPKAGYLNEDQIARVVNASPPDLRKMVNAALFTGARYGELANALVAHFNEDSWTLYIPASKSGKSRHIHLNEEGVSFFSQIVAGRPGDAFLLLKQNGGKWGPAHQTRPLREACRAAGISPPASFHILRHTYASHLVMAGVPLPVVAENLGHTSTRMTEKHYSHLARSFVSDTIRKLAPSLGVVEAGKVTSLRVSQRHH